jgi:aldehyde:ferredoxin oxidoreductase
MGVTAGDDVLPKRIMTALKEGAGAGSVPDVARLKGEYYVLRGLDGRGFPRQEKLSELGLDELRQRLYPK